MYNLFLIIVLSKMFSYLYTSVVWKLCCILRNDKHPAKYLIFDVDCRKKMFFFQNISKICLFEFAQKKSWQLASYLFLLFLPHYIFYIMYMPERTHFDMLKKVRNFVLSLDSNQCVKIKMNISCQDQKCYKFSVIKTFVWFVTD